MRRLLLIANPAASGFTASLHRDVVEILQASFDVTPIWPNGPAEARSEATAAAAAGFEVVVAMGGDGVVHEVANGIIGTDTALGIVPAGTTNVMRRIVGLPRKPRDAAEALAAARGTRALPTLAVEEGSSEHLRHHVATFAAGVGFDAEVIQESERRPFRKVGFGVIHYTRSAASVALKYRRRTPTLSVSDGTRTLEAVAVQLQVHDAFTYLGRLPLTLGAGPKPIAMIIQRVTTLRLLGMAARSVLRRDPAAMRGIEIWEGFDSIEISAEPKSWVEADGELLGRAARIRVSPEPQALFVLDT